MGLITYASILPLSAMCGFLFGLSRSYRLKESPVLPPIWLIYLVRLHLGFGLSFLLVISLFKDPFFSLPPFFAHNFRDILVAYFGSLFGFLIISESVIRFRLERSLSSLFIPAMFFLCTGLIPVTLQSPVFQECQAIREKGVVLQSTPYTCVPASLSNILSTYGIHYSEKELARRLKTSTSGTHLASVIYEASFLGLRVEHAIIEKEKLKEIKVPTMLTVDHPSTGPSSHVVACMGFREGRFILMDPLIGLVKMYPAELYEIFRGELLIFPG